MSRYALEKKCGVSRERIGCIESGDSIPSCISARGGRMGWGMTLATFVGKLEDASASD